MQFAGREACANLKRNSIFPSPPVRAENVRGFNPRTFVAITWGHVD
jgi:hypothetical protein